jgi:ribonuclease P protein component
MTESTNLPRLRFPQTRRLKLSREFERVRKEGRTFRGSLLLLGVLDSAEEMFRVGFVTSKRVGGAVVRNRLRRRLREIVRRHQHAIAAGVWFVLVPRASAARASPAALEDEWLRLAKRASILRP